MAELTIRESLNKALKEALDNNENVFLMGEDIGMYGGPYAVTKGLLEEYGSEKIMDTPISESGFVGAAIGASMAGMKPIVEIMTINFSLLAIDQIVNHAAKIHYMSDGQLSVPIIIRTVTGAGGRLAATHSQSFEGWYASVPGLKVVSPSNAIDALGLFRSAINENNPDNIKRALSYLNRDQYGSWSITDREQSLLNSSYISRWVDKKNLRNPTRKEVQNFVSNYQFKEMYFRYFAWQFVGRENADNRTWNLVTKKGEFIKITKAGFYESMVHNVDHIKKNES